MLYLMPNKDYVMLYLALILLFVTCFSFAESVEQDQSAHTCSLILLYTLRNSIITFCQRKAPYPIPCNCNHQLFKFGVTRVKHCFSQCCKFLFSGENNNGEESDIFLSSNFRYSSDLPGDFVRVSGH